VFFSKILKKKKEPTALTLVTKKKACVFLKSKIEESYKKKGGTQKEGCTRKGLEDPVFFYYTSEK